MTFKVIRIEKREIGHNQPVFIIAEIGVNHNGDVELAKKMVQAAAESGADCVKFQTFKAERVVTKDAFKANYQLKTTNPAESQLNMLKKLEFPQDDYKEIIACCNTLGVSFISTPYNVEDVDFLDDLGIPAFKLASIHASEPWFAQYTAKKGKPIILSTGMATLGEIDETVRAIRNAGNEELALLQCTTNYPSKIEDANLKAMQTMANAFKVQVGYSDHTQNDTACLVSIGLGAKIIEKHFTLDKSLPGPDQSSSAEPDEFSKLVRKIRDAEKALGPALKEPCDIEKENAYGMRRSIVTKFEINCGEVINEDMVTFKRPATGIPPKYLKYILGKKSQFKLPADTIIQWSHIGE